ncbi:peptidase M10 [Larkinella soli]|uniref:peptidase M10 n=1 Tax=Larkinella soli TaxID=1770527 RepID=UPI000FFBCEF1|nr:peptidase M10 [Larkinella soli]
MSLALISFSEIHGNQNVIKDEVSKTITVYAALFFYGSAATHEIARRIARNIERLWNGPEVILSLDDREYLIRFRIKGRALEPGIPAERYIHDNLDYKNYFIRIEPATDNPLGGISYVDGLNANTGFFRLDNVGYENSTTEAHEMGHLWGLVPGTPDGHPSDLNLIGKGRPAIMYPRGTLVDPQYQWDPTARPGEYGGTLRPDYRVVTLEDTILLGIDRLRFDQRGRAKLGGLSSIYHDYRPPSLPV